MYCGPPNNYTTTGNKNDTKAAMSQFNIVASPITSDSTI